MKKIKRDFLKQLEKAKNIVIALSESATKETVCAALALHSYLKKNDKQIFLVSPRKQNSVLAFLKGFNQIKQDLPNLKEFVFSFDTSKNEIKNVRHEREGNKLNIYVTPAKGEINPKDFYLHPGQQKIDLLITLAASELNNLGRIFEKNTDIFFEKPIVNIDNKIENDQYGQLNIVDIKALGITEILTDIFIKNQIPLDKDTASALYAGILEATESFRSPKTTPATLNLAARLIEQGADQKEIVKHLYKSNNFSTVKIWGRIMARMNYEQDINLCWTRVYEKDFIDQKFDVNLMRSIFEKIRLTYDKKDTLMFLWQKEDKTQGLIQNANQYLLKDILGGLEWGEALIFEIDKKFDEAKEKIIGILRENLKS
ncbi:MAG: hypothetical protein GF347_02560 [Candidatus Moranbacteria bacterium]|nr:hypothetical protein [Candidatus Moranbacteria bacterium]